ncbi:MAG: hypothetical protein QNJ98_04195 [Planctomycetota bacterium]|nr:hypothetical protein [Planctomycetota bacterium]
MNDANQGADGRRRGSADDGGTSNPDVPNAKRDRLDPGFDPDAIVDDGTTNPGAGMPGPDEMGSVLRDALYLEVDADPSSEPSQIAADEPLSLDAAISSYGAALAPADLEDEAWCRAVLEQPAVRADLVDLARAVEDAERAPTAHALRPSVHQAALGAFDRAAAAATPTTPDAATPSAAPASDTRPPLRAVPAQQPTLLSWLGWRAAAAVVLVALGVTIVAMGGLLHDDVTGNGAGAEAGLRLDHVTEHRLDAAGFVSRERWVRVGESFSPTADRVVVFGLGEASHVLVGDGDRLGVAKGTAIDARLMARARDDLAKASRELDLAAVLRLEAGEAQLDSDGRRPVLLAVGDELLLVLFEGLCHVAIDPGAEAGAVGPAIALGKGARATVYRTANGDRDAKTFELAGPQRVLLGVDGPKAFGTPAASLFRDLELFGGALDAARAVDRAVPIQATLWRALDDGAVRTNGRFRLAGAGAPRLAFRPPSTLYGATALRVWLRAPSGTRVVLRAAKAPDAELGAVALDRDTQKAEPGVGALRVPLPGDWYTQLAGGELVLEIVPVEGTAGTKTYGYFEGAAFVMDDAAPRHVEPESSK